MGTDILDLLLADDDQPAPKAEAASPQVELPKSDELDLLMEEFRSSPDATSQKEALMAMLQLLKK